MPSDEEKLRDALDRHLADLPQAPEEPVELFKPEPAVPPRPPEPAKPEAYEPSTYEEKKERKYWPVALATTLFVLGGGGFYAMTGMKDTARKLGGGTESDMRSERGASSGGGIFGRAWDIFADDEEGASSGAAKLTSSLNPNILRAAAMAEIKSSRAAAPLESFGPGAGRSGVPPAAQAPRAGGPSGRMVSKLQSATAMPAGAGGSKTEGSGGGAAGGMAGNGTVVGTASAQQETAGGPPKGTNKQNVMDSLKETFSSSLRGARIASQDSAKDWVAKSFHATSSPGATLDYGEEFRSKLDKVNPDSIPNFLREQDVDGKNARRLANSPVSKPKMDRAGTDAALEKDEAYQRKKMFAEAGGALGGKDGKGGGGGGGDGGGGGGSSGGGSGGAALQSANGPGIFSETPQSGPVDAGPADSGVAAGGAAGDGKAGGDSASGTTAPTAASSGFWGSMGSAFASGAVSVLGSPISAAVASIVPGGSALVLTAAGAAGAAAAYNQYANPEDKQALADLESDQIQDVYGAVCGTAQAPEQCPPSTDVSGPGAGK